MSAPVWLSAPAFGKLASISRRKACAALRRSIDGKTWRGSRLDVRALPGRGGRSGLRYEVRLDSLPTELQSKWIADHGQLAASRGSATLPAKYIEPAAALATAAGVSDADEWAQRFGIIAPVLAHSPGSKERGAAIRATAAATGHGTSTIRRWVASYTCWKLAGLKRKRRADAGRSRWPISRAWRDLCDAYPISVEARAEVVSKATKRSLSYSAAGTKSAAEVAALLKEDLVDWTRAALAACGAEAPDDALRAACTVPRSFVDRDRPAGRLVWKYRHDARYRYNTLEANVTRSWESMDGQWTLEGDFTAVDVPVLHDGQRKWARVCFWLNTATRQLYGTLHIFEERPRLTMASAAWSFIQVVCGEKDDGSDGIGLAPFNRFDGGPEFGVFRKTFYRDLMWLNSACGYDVTGDPAGGAAPISKTIPHEPRGKLIESYIGQFNRYLAQLPEWAGPDRLQPRAPRLGKKGPAMSADRLEKVLNTFLCRYNSKSQAGHLGGKSPNEMAAIMKLRRTQCPRAVLAVAFGREVSRKVTRGHFHFKGVEFYDDRLQAMSDRYVRFRHSIFPDVQYVAVLLGEGKPPLLVEPKPKHHQQDRRGARWRSEQRKLLRGAIEQIEARTEPVDIVAATQRANANAMPLPQLEFTGRVQLSDEEAAVVAEVKKLPKRQARAKQPYTNELARRWREAPLRKAGGD